MKKKKKKNRNRYYYHNSGMKGSSMKGRALKKSNNDENESRNPKKRGTSRTLAGNQAWQTWSPQTMSWSVGPRGTQRELEHDYADAIEESWF